MSAMRSLKPRLYEPTVRTQCMSDMSNQNGDRENDHLDTGRFDPFGNLREQEEMSTPVFDGDSLTGPLAQLARRRKTKSQPRATAEGK